MISNETELDQLHEILKKHPKGLTIAEIAKKADINRQSASKYLSILLGAGMAEARVYGPSKVFYPSQRLPISSMLNISTSLLLLLNTDLSIIDANIALLNFFGLDKEDIIGKRIEYSPLGSFFDSELLLQIEQALDSAEKYLEINWNIHGEERNFTLKIIPTLFENGNHGGILIAEDITEITQYRQNLERLVEVRSKELSTTNEKLKKEIDNHKKVRAKLKKSEQKYRDLVENANSLIIRVDKSGNITFFNEFAEHFLGYSEQELIGRNIHDTVFPIIDSSGKNVVRFTQDYLKTLENNVINICETRKKDGNRVWISYTNKVIKDSHNDVAGILFIGHDFTERKEIEEKLIAIINFLPDPTFVIDTKGKVIAWNRAIETLTGVKAEEIIGKKNNEYSVAVYNVREPMLIDYALKPDQKIPPNYFNCQRNESEFFAETYSTYLDPNGIYLWGKASPLYNSSGDLIGAIESLRDMTLLKKSHELYKLQDTN